jgi:DDE family transposase
MNMPLDAFLTALYTKVDDWYQAHGPALLAGKVGAPPLFSDSEVITLALAQHWCGFAKEREWLRFIDNNYRALFPKLLSQSEFNRRARNLCWLINEMRRWVLDQMGAYEEEYRLIDGTPIQVRHWRRYGPTHLMLPEAALGYCAAKKEPFYGYRLVVLTTLAGVITDWGLIPANGDEREAALDLLESYRDRIVFGDKGFLDRLRQALLAELTGNQLLTPKRANQKEPQPPAWEALMNRFRRLIESTFSQGKDCFGLEKPRARSLWGVLSRLIAKLTGMTIAAWANVAQGRSPLALADFSF